MNPHSLLLGLKRFSRVVWMAALLAVQGGQQAAAGPSYSLVHVNDFAITVPSGLTDQNGKSVSVGELSAITYLYDDPVARLSSYPYTTHISQFFQRHGTPNYLAIEDKNGTLVGLNVQLDAAGAITAATVTGALTLEHTDLDFEGLIYSAQDFSVYASYEGQADGMGEWVARNGIRQYALKDGAYQGAIELPAQYTRVSERVKGETNTRSNDGLESLARALNGGAISEIWTANEQALRDDGERASYVALSPVRLTRFTKVGANFVAAAQYVYLVDPIHARGGSREEKSGLTELVVLPDGTVIAMERSFCGLGCDVNWETRFYQLDFSDPAGVDDVLSVGGLYDQTYTPVRGIPLLRGPFGDTADYFVDGMDLEGLTLGPALTVDGSKGWSLLSVVDSGDPYSSNKVVAFRVMAIPEPPMSLLSLILVLPAFHWRCRGRRLADLAR